jgi:hypothetical protein
LDNSKNANAAIELIKVQETTKQHEAAAKRAEMDAYTQQQRAANIESEAQQARKTLDAQTQHEKQRLEYHDQLERKRQVDMLNAQKYMQEYVFLSLFFLVLRMFLPRFFRFAGWFQCAACNFSFFFSFLTGNN